MLTILSGSRQLPWGVFILLKAYEVNVVVLTDSCTSMLEEELAAAVSPFMFPFVFARACFPSYELPFL